MVTEVGAKRNRLPGGRLREVPDERKLEVASGFQLQSKAPPQYRVAEGHTGCRGPHKVQFATQGAEGHRAAKSHATPRTLGLQIPMRVVILGLSLYSTYNAYFKADSGGNKDRPVQSSEV